VEEGVREMAMQRRILGMPFGIIIHWPHVHWCFCELWIAFFVQGNAILPKGEAHYIK
jgi:hypothetical protein